MKLILNLLTLPMNLVGCVFFLLYAVLVFVPFAVVCWIGDNLFGCNMRAGTANYTFHWFKW